MHRTYTRTRVAGLPSGESAARLVRGDLDALPLAALHTLGRASLIGAGLAIAGLRENLVKYSLSAAVAIEGFVLLWSAWEARKEAR